jgi:hypothetical protein
LAEASIESEARISVARRQGSRAITDEGAKKMAQDLISSAKSGTQLDAALVQLLERLHLPLPSNPTDTETSEPNDDRAPRALVSPTFAPTGTPGRDFSPFSDIGRQVFALEKPGDLIGNPVLTLRGPAAVALISKEAAKREDFDKEAGDLMRSLQEAKGQAALQDVLARSRRAIANKIAIANEYKNLKVRSSDD